MNRLKSVNHAQSVAHIIDRDSNHYKETIKDKDGKVIVNKDEKLSEHRDG